jgi:limonene-1,2-epoxide hydrolase
MEAQRPQQVVEQFLAAMEAGDADAAGALLHPEIVYINVGLPALRGSRRVQRVLDLLRRPQMGFGVVVHAIAADGNAVLTERTDRLDIGRFQPQFWVWGRFDVADGKIILWRDSFDNLDIARSIIRALAAMIVPSLAPSWPDPNGTPGRH